jgi:hypothetical protein
MSSRWAHLLLLALSCECALRGSVDTDTSIRDVSLEPGDTLTVDTASNEVVLTKGTALAQARAAGSDVASHAGLVHAAHLLMDTNRDGFVTQEELQKLVAATYGADDLLGSVFVQGGPGAEGVAEAGGDGGGGGGGRERSAEPASDAAIETVPAGWEHVDADANGKLTYAEFEAFFGGGESVDDHGAGALPAELQYNFAQMDADRNGQLSRAEFEAYFDYSADSASVLDAGDKDRDGRLSEEETRALEPEHFPLRLAGLLDEVFHSEL